MDNEVEKFADTVQPDVKIIDFANDEHGEIAPILKKQSTVNFDFVDKIDEQIVAHVETQPQPEQPVVVEEFNDAESGKMTMSLSGKGSTSGAGTIVGDNMALGDDPFNGRINMFAGSKPGRASVNVDSLLQGSNFKLIDDDSDSVSNRGSMVSG